MKTTKRLLSTALALTLGLTTTINLAACGGKENHTHAFTQWTFAEGESCNGGLFTRICPECEYVEERFGTEEDHKWSSSYGYDGFQHWKLCDLCDDTTTKEYHQDNGAGICGICQQLIATDCVTYEISQDGTYAIATGYDEAETDVIVIASTYQGLPVKEIAESAFEGCSRLARATLPDSITTIGENAFNGCKKLMGVYLSKNLTAIGENAFAGCAWLTIFTAQNKESIPEGWHENFNPDKAHMIWNHDGKQASNVSIKAITIADGMLRHEDSDRTQILSNPDLAGMRAPDGFSKITRFDGKTTPPGTPWTEGNLWHHNWDQTDLTDYQEVWFAAKLQNANWVFVHDRDAEQTPPSWMYVYMKQTGESSDGYTLWTIELSIGGYVCTTIEGQTGRAYDDNRPKNSIARLFWDEGFGSPDGNAILIYNFIPEEEREEKPLTIYCTEVLGVKTSIF